MEFLVKRGADVNAQDKQGWKLYRIWSTDWFHDKQKASEKLKEELDKALREKTSTVA